METLSAYAVALPGNKEQRERKQDLRQTINNVDENQVFSSY